MKPTTKSGLTALLGGTLGATISYVLLDNPAAEHAIYDMMQYVPHKTTYDPLGWESHVMKSIPGFIVGVLPTPVYELYHMVQTSRKNKE